MTKSNNTAAKATNNTAAKATNNTSAKATKKTAAPKVETVTAVAETVEVEATTPVVETTVAEIVAAPAAETKPVKEPKFLTQSDKIALRVIEKIREDRTGWESTEINGQKAFVGKIGMAIVNIVRNEKPGKKGRETIVLNEIIVTPPEGKVLVIRAGFAARAWHALTKEFKGPRAKVAPDAETLEAAAVALGL